MQKTVYYCDQCKSIIGDKKHFSLRFGANSGLACPPTNMAETIRDYWHTEPSINGKFVHLHVGACVNKFFLSLISEKPKKKSW